MEHFSKYRLWEIEDRLVSCTYVAEFAWQALRQHDETAGFVWTCTPGIHFSKDVTLFTIEETSYFGIQHLGRRSLPRGAQISDAKPDEPTYQAENIEWVNWAVAAFPGVESIRLGRRIGRGTHSADCGDLVPEEECLAIGTMKPQDYIVYDEDPYMPESRWTFNYPLRICNQCELHHYENCSECFGFGLYVTSTYDVPMPIPIRVAIEGRVPDGAWKMCGLCQSTVKGLSDQQKGV